MTLFSLITITRDNQEGLARTYASLAAQDCSDYEWIVIDGASADSTLAFMAGKPALLVSEPDQGLYDAMNKGIDRAAGDYLIFMNAGDSFAGPDVLSGLAAVLTAGRPVFLYADAREEMADGTYFYKHARGYETIARGMFTHHQAMVYSRAALGALRYDLSYKIAADYDLTCRFLARHKEGKVIYWPHALCLFAAGGISQRRAALGRREQCLIRRKLGISGPVYNTALYAVQALALFIRRRCPALYRFFRARIMR